MAGYSTSNPPRCIVGRPGGGTAGAIWYYSSDDAVSAVRVSGYFTNGYKLGMRKGDVVIVCDNDASPITGAMCWVTEATSTTTDLSDGVTITGTDSD